MTNLHWFLGEIAPKKFNYAIEKFDEMKRPSDRYNQVFAVSLHSFVSAQSYRLYHLRRLLENIKSHQESVWITTLGEMASH